jgi:hypothetical protein
MKTSVFKNFLFFLTLLTTGFSSSSKTTLRETIKAFNRKCRVVLQSGESKGSVALQALSNGLESGSFKIVLD